MEASSAALSPFSGSSPAAPPAPLRTVDDGKVPGERRYYLLARCPPQQPPQYALRECPVCLGEVARAARWAELLACEPASHGLCRRCLLQLVKAKVGEVGQ